MAMKRKRYNADSPSVSYDQADFEALRASQIPATLARQGSLHFDSAEDASVFFARELDYIKAETYDVLYPEFTANNLFPTSSEVDPGAQSVTFYSYDKSGFAKIIQNYATDLPVPTLRAYLLRLTFSASVTVSAIPWTK